MAKAAGRRSCVVAETDAGDYAFLDVTKPAFDLTDRGVDGRPSPGPLDLFATTERGVYRPGETVFLTALLRDTQAKAVADLPLTLKVERPDGVIADRAAAQRRRRRWLFLAAAARRRRHARLLDGRGSMPIPRPTALTSTSFLVEDFEPERLAFEVSAAG